MREFIITANDAGQRLDKFLAKSLPALPASLMHKYIRLKRVKLNGKRAETGARLCEGDRLQLYLNDEFFEKPGGDQAWRGLTPRLDVVYEDENLLLCDKAPGMVVHEDESGSRDTLINHIKAYLVQSGGWRPQDAHSFAPALCNRIDRNTSGLVIAAKTAEALRVLNDKIRDREVQKEYLCLVHGVPSPRSGVLTHYITRDLEDKRVFVSSRPAPSAKTAVLRYRVLDSRGGLSLVACQLMTGRTHQIRAQMAYIGHPLAGDTKYGTAKQNANIPFRFQALHAYRLTFAFTSPAGALDYLAGKRFEAAKAPFLPYFYTLPSRADGPGENRRNHEKN